MTRAKRRKTSRSASDAGRALREAGRNPTSESSRAAAIRAAWARLTPEERAARVERAAAASRKSRGIKEK